LKRVYVVALAVLLLVIVAAGAYYYSAPKPIETITVIMGTNQDVTETLDPAQDYGYALNLNYNVFDQLYEAQPSIYPDIKLEPRLAAGEPIVSPDGLEWTIPLRRDVVFHDGTPFNASAMKFSLDRVKELNSYPAWLLDSIARVEVVDTYTIKIVQNYAYAGLKAILTLPVSSPVSPTAVQNMGLQNFQEKPVGTGPYKYVEWVRGDHVTLAPFEGYWNKSRIPKVDKFIYKIFADSSTMKLALEKGEIDVVWDYLTASDILSSLKNSELSYITHEEGYQHLLALNTGLPDSPLQDVRVRKAIAYSIDKDEISNRVYQGLFPPLKDTMFLPGFMPKPSWAQYTPDIAKAKQLLAEAGYPNGTDVTLWYTPIANGKEEADLAVVIQEQLAKAGIRVHLNSQEEGSFLERFRAGEFEMALGIMSGDYPDPDSVAYFVANSQGSYTRRVRVNDTLLDQLTVQGRIEADPAERENIYGQVQDRLADIMCYVPLVRISNYMFFRSNVTGVEPYYLAYSPWWLIAKTQS